ELEDNGYLMNRQLHLNYYAVEGVLARAYLYAGNLALARQHANNVINSGKFSYSTQSNLISGADYTGAPEHLFGLQINNLHQNAVANLSHVGNSIFSLNVGALGTYYENNTDDYRFLYLFRLGSGANA